MRTQRSAQQKKEMAPQPHRASPLHERDQPPLQRAIMRVQKAAGNQAALRLLRASMSTNREYSGLEVSQPGDRYEREAEQVAAVVMGSMYNSGHSTNAKAVPPSVSRISGEATPLQANGGCACGGHSGDTPCVACAKKARLQRSAEGEAANGPVAPIVHDVLRSPGQALDENTRALMEPRFGHDFSGVRIHTDTQAAASARAVSAKAYTVGSHIVFGHGYYAPQAANGQKILAHELAHTIQQGSSPESLGHESNLRLQRLASPILQRQTDATVEAGTGVGPAITAGTMTEDKAINKQNVRADNCFGREDCNIDFHFDKAYTGDYSYVGGGGKMVRGVYVKISARYKADACGPCDKIQLLQVLRNITRTDGKMVSADPGTATRRARSGWDDPKSKSRGWRVDALESETTPYYSTGWVGQEGSATKPAILWDTPGDWSTDTNAGKEFETCAICTPRTGPSTTLACVRWGYYIDDTGKVAFRPAVPVAYCGVTQPLNDATLRWGTIAGNTPANIDFRKQPPPPAK